MDFKDRLRSLREERKLNTTQLANLFNKSEGAVRMWENGRSKPDADTLIELSKFFTCSTDYLLGLSNYKNFTEYEDVNKKLEILDDHLKTKRLIFDHDFEGFIISLVDQLVLKNPTYRFILMDFFQTLLDMDLERDEIETLDLIDTGLHSLNSIGQALILGDISGLIASGIYKRPSDQEKPVIRNLESITETRFNPCNDDKPSIIKRLRNSK